MLCDVCKKNKATVHLTEIINDDMTELHLCEECAKSKGTEMHQHFNIAALLSGLVDLPSQTQRQEHIRIKCKNCGMSYSDFKKIGRFGCAECYETFKRALYPLFKRIHGTQQHVGLTAPVPEPLAKKEKVGEVKAKSKQQIPMSELEGLKLRLTKAIEREEFEEAAILRDKIKELERKARDKQP